MDLAQLDLELASKNGVDVFIKHPVSWEQLKNSQGEDVVIKIFGQESAKWKAIASLQKSKFAGKPVDAASDEFKEAMREVMASCIISWNFEFGGEVLDCSYENAYRILKNGGFDWLLKQLMAASGDGNLIPLGRPNG